MRVPENKRRLKNLRKNSSNQLEKNNNSREKDSEFSFSWIFSQFSILEEISKLRREVSEKKILIEGSAHNIAVACKQLELDFLFFVLQLFWACLFF